MLRICAARGCSTKTLERYCLNHDQTLKRTWPRGRPFMTETSTALELRQRPRQPIDVALRVVALNGEPEQRTTLVVEARDFDPIVLT